MKNFTRGVGRDGRVGVGYVGVRRRVSAYICRGDESAYIESRDRVGCERLH